jgi:hypothetical protein
MDELEAMNLLLRAIGSAPVNSLETAHPDAVNARAWLDRIRKQSQLTGWWFNIDYCVAFQPQPDGFILIPSTISKVVFENQYLVNRGGKLYDNLNQTYSFAEQQLAERVQYMTPWDEMPVSLQFYTAYFAASRFIDDELEDMAKSQGFKEEAGAAGLLMKKDDLEQGRYNVFDKPRVRRARLGVRPYALHDSNVVGFDGSNQYGGAK